MSKKEQSNQIIFSKKIPNSHGIFIHRDQLRQVLPDRACDKELRVGVVWQACRARHACYDKTSVIRAVVTLDHRGTRVERNCSSVPPQWNAHSRPSRAIVPAARNGKLGIAWVRGNDGCVPLSQRECGLLGDTDKRGGLLVNVSRLPDSTVVFVHEVGLSRYEKRARRVRFQNVSDVVVGGERHHGPCVAVVHRDHHSGPLPTVQYVVAIPIHR